MLIKNVMYIQIILALIAGFISFVFDALVLYLFVLIGFNYLLAAGISFMVGVTFNFFLTKKFVFKIEIKMNPFKEMFIFIFVASIGLILTELLMYLFTKYMGIYFMLSKFLATIFVFMWNFLIRKLYIYREK